MSKIRNAKREEKTANDFFQSLLNQFINFKNLHFVEEEGILVFDTEVRQKANELKNEWISFCNRKNGKGFLVYHPKTLHNKIEEHLESHRQLAWANQVARLIKEKYAIDQKPDIKELIQLYQDKHNCEDAAKLITKQP
jgi:hypothetical protein